MNSLGYKYINIEEIVKNIPHLSNFSNYQFIILIFLLGITLLLIYYILPLINISLDFVKKENIKNKRKQFIYSIAMQKNLEDEIVKQIDKENEGP